MNAYLKSRSGDVSAFPPSNLLIITDHAGNVRRMLTLINRLDLPVGGAQIWVVQPQHADPAELAKLLGDIFAPGGSMAGPTPAVSAGGDTPPSSAQQPAVRFLADPAGGVLLVIGSEAAFHRVESLLKVLDVGNEASRAQVWVYRLKHAMAEPLAAALGSMVGGGGRAQVGSKSGPATNSASVFEGQVRVNPEPSSNSLLITASPRDYLQVRRVIEELDQQRRQIFIEAYVLEVSLDSDLGFGISGHLAGPAGGGTALLGSYPNGFSSVATDPTTLTGLALGVTGPTIPGVKTQMTDPTTKKTYAVDVPAFSLVLQAMQADSKVNVLSSPTVLATENEDAEFQVGENIPVRGSYNGASLATGQLNMLSALAPSVERKNVGLILKIKPTITGEDRIRLKLHQEISAVKSDDFGGLGASTSQRLIDSVITLHDQQTVVIGGLISEQQNLSESKVPVLGDIPLLGRLFRREGKKTNRRNLLLVLTPYLLRDDADLRHIYKKKLEERQSFLRRYAELKGATLDIDVDYRHKRGLLSEINRVGAEVDADAQLAAHAKAAPARSRITHIP